MNIFLYIQRAGAIMVLLQVMIMPIWTCMLGCYPSSYAAAVDMHDDFIYLQERDYELNVTYEVSKIFIARFGVHPHYDELTPALDLTHRYVLSRRTWLKNATTSGYLADSSQVAARRRELKDAEAVLESLEELHSLNLVHFSKSANTGLNNTRHIAKVYKQWFLLTGNLTIAKMAVNRITKLENALLQELQISSDNEDLITEFNRTLNEKAVLRQMFELTLLRLSLYEKLEKAEKLYAEYIASLDYTSGINSFDAVEEFLLGVEDERKRIQLLRQEHPDIVNDYSAFPWAGASLSLEKLDNITTTIRNTFSKRRKSFDDNALRRYFLSPFFSGVISLTGIVWNGALLFAFARAPELRKAPNIMIFNITIVDILALANVPFAYVYWYHRNALGLTVGGCRIYLQFRDLLIAVGEMSVVALGVQRFVATTTVMQNGESLLGQFLSLPPVFKLSLYVLGVWFLAAVLHLLPLIAGGHYPEGSCFYIVPDKSLRDALNTLRFVLQVAILPAIMFLLSMLTARRLRRSAKEMPGNGGCQQRIARYRSARVVTALAGVFALSYIPRYIFIFVYLRYGLDMANRTTAWIHHVVYFLSFCNSCFNPIALYFASGTFRKNFNKYLLCCQGLHKTVDKQFHKHPKDFTLTSASSCVSIGVELQQS